MKTKTTLLVKIDSYHHEETIRRFMDGFDLSYEETKDIFQEMKRFLSLCHQYPNEYIFTHEPLWIIDEMWHTFLLFSADYYDFCMKFFGRMIHHGITPRAQKQKIIKDLETNKEATEEILRPVVSNLYNKIYEFLGRETLIKWIKIYGEKYTIAYMNEIRKPITV